MCVFLYMHPSPDFLPQPASQQDSHQCHVDDNSAGEDNGGPGKSHWHGVITARQQFYTDRVNADSATRMTAWESIELLGWPILMAKKKTASVPRIIRAGR